VSPDTVLPMSAKEFFMSAFFAARFRTDDSKHRVNTKKNASRCEARGVDDN
jgi:hypothetical protein